jgi:hypothetical protein
VAHVYAGILGPLAFLTSLARGALHGGGTESVLWTAWCCLLVFSVVGYLVGWVAGKTVEESVRGRIAAELAAQQSSQTPQSAGPGTAG